MLDIIEVTELATHPELWGSVDQLTWVWTTDSES